MYCGFGRNGFNASGILTRVDLRCGHDHGLRRKLLAEGAQLFQDHVEVMSRIEISQRAQFRVEMIDQNDS